MMNRTVTVIPAKPAPPKRVAIYCRVSTYSQEQIHSLINQIAYLTQEVGSDDVLRIVGVYVDVGSGSSVKCRSEYLRMLSDCRKGLVDVVFAKSISRFGRDSLTAISAVQELVNLGVLVHFSEYDIGTDRPGGILQFQIAASLAEEENRTRSKNIIWGIKAQAEAGSSNLYNRKCYGYRYEQGQMVIVPSEAEVVQMIYNMYLAGASILKIKAELESKEIPSPTGNTQWCKRTIDSILSNEKYYGDVMVLKTYSSGFPSNRRVQNSGRDDAHPLFCAEQHHEGIITREKFDAVQLEKRKRSNVEFDDSGHRKRSSVRYKSK